MMISEGFMLNSESNNLISSAAEKKGRMVSSDPFPVQEAGAPMMR